MTLPIAVLYDRADGLRFLAERPTVRSICALTPVAELVAKDADLPVFGGRVRYGDCSQARTLAMRQRLLRRWRELIPSNVSIDAAVWYVLELSLATLLHGYIRLRRIVGNQGPWLVPSGDAWVVHGRREDACLALSRHILSRYWHFIGNIVCKPPPFVPLYRLLRAALLIMGRGNSPSWVTSRSDHPLGLERALMSARKGSRQWHVSAVNLGWREYLKLLREMWRASRGATQIQICAVPRDRQLYENHADQAIDALPNAEYRKLLREFTPRIRELSGVSGGSRSDIGKMLAKIRPDFMLSSEIADCVTAALFEAAGDAGIKRCIASHNTFAPTRDEINLIALRHLLGHQYGEGAAEQMLFWNPKSLIAAKQAMPDATDRCHALAAVAVAPAISKLPDSNSFHVLHATNCMRYFSRPSWLYEDVNEFVDGAVALVRAGLKVDGTTYMVRTKPREYEMDEDLLRTRLPDSDRIEIAFRYTRPFKEDLDRAHLLVAFHSTTIMQALHARKPVLLWGITPRFREFPGREEPPRPNDRAAVYTVDNPDNLTGMIAGIRDAHRDRPLTDDELAPYVFAPGTMTIDAWARQWLM